MSTAGLKTCLRTTLHIVRHLLEGCRWVAVCGSCNVQRLFSFDHLLSAPHRHYRTNYTSCTVRSHVKLQRHSQLSLYPFKFCRCTVTLGTPNISLVKKLSASPRSPVSPRFVDKSHRLPREPAVGISWSSETAAKHLLSEPVPGAPCTHPGLLGGENCVYQLC